MAISLPDARQLSDEALQSLRLRALRGCELGYSEIEVAELLGLPGRPSRGGGPPTLIMAWKLSRRPHGRPVGTGRTLNGGQAARLRTILNEKSPEEVGIASPLWTRRAVAELIRKEYGIDMPVRTVGEYLERWGYTAKVPRHHAKQDPEEVRHWLEVTYPAMQAGPPVRMRRSTGATRPARRPTSNRNGVTPARGGGEDRGARSPHPHEPDLDD